MPPFGVGASSAPFAGEATPSAPLTGGAPLNENGELNFNPEKPPAIRWLSWSTLIFVVLCSGGVWRFMQMRAERVLAAPKAPAAAPAEVQKPVEAPSAAPTPFTALKQAKDTIKNAGEQHQAAYAMVEKMLDDPNAATDAAKKPAPQVVMFESPAPTEATAKPSRDFAAMQLGSDGEFVVPAGSPRPSVGFVRWIKAAKIGGVRLTERPRVLIGTTGYTFGDVVDLNLGVVLEGYNAETRALRFKEPSGAVIERRI